MATTSLQSEETWRLYSWWWDSHISPTNSRWLQENLSDMDGKVKAMIKLIEEDADSFARRAEMYYKKRPQLVNLVEEFYRAYRALAESFDSATGDAQKLIEQTNRSEIEVQILKQVLSISNEEREAMATETVSKLWSDLCCAQIDIEKLNDEIVEGLKRLKSTEKQCVDLRRLNHDLELEADNATKMIIMKDDELLQKKDELEKLWSVQKENSRLLKLLKDSENCRDELERDNRRLSNENERLNNLNISSNILIKDMQNDAFDLGEAKGKLQVKIDKQLEEKSLLVAEKLVLFSQLQALSENIQKLLEKNTKMENLFTAVNVDLEGLKANSLGERELLGSQLEIIERRLENMEKRFLVLEEGYAGMEKGKASVLQQIEELQVSLGKEVEERKNFVLLSEGRFVEFENNLHLLQEESEVDNPKGIYEEEDAAVNTEVEIYALRKRVQEMEENDFCQLMETQQLIAALELSEKLVMELESENLEQKVVLEFLIDETKTLKTGFSKISQALQDGLENEVEPVMPQIEKKIETMKNRLWMLEEEKDQGLIENSILYALIRGLGVEGRNLNQELKIKKEKFATVQNDKHALQEYNRRLMLKISERNHQELLKAEIVKDLRKKVKDLQENYGELEARNFNAFQSEKICQDLQISFGCEILSENKVHEQLKERICSLENELGKIRARLSSFDPVICSLNENITSLERKAIFETEEGKYKDGDARVDFLEDHCEHRGISDLRKIQTTIQRVEKAVIELKSLKRDETRVLNWAMTDEVNGLMKDIQLDDGSNRSSFQRFLEPEKMAEKSASGRRSGIRCNSKEKIRILQVQKIRNALPKVGEKNKNRGKNRSSGVVRELIYGDGGRQSNKGCFCG